MRNLVVGYVGQFLALAMAFVTRTVLIRHISITYVGLNGVFSNLLMIFSLANMGVGSAIGYALYKPLAEKDEYQVSQLVLLLRKYYVYIGVAILVMGLAITPFLHLFIKPEELVADFYLLYFAFLISNITPYFTGSAFRTLLLSDQKLYIDHLLDYATLFVMNVVQIVVILVSGSYLYYILIQLAKVLLFNLLVRRYTYKAYPYLSNIKWKSPITVDQSKIRENIRFKIVDNIGWIAMSSTDNLIIAGFISLSVAGVYSNYLMIITTVQTAIRVFFKSITGSLGNLNVEGDAEHKESVFDTVVFLAHFLYGSCFIGMFYLLNDVIRIWLGADFMLEKLTVFFIAFGFYLGGLRKPYDRQKEAMGLFRQGRYLRLIMACVNIGLTLILVRPLGITGVFVGTAVSYLGLSYWYDPYLLNKYGFSGNVSKGMTKQIKYTLVTFLLGCILFVFFDGWQVVSFIELIFKFVMLALILLIVQGAIYRKSAQMSLLKKIGLHYIKERS